MNRRTLDFTSFDEVFDDVERLRRGGYEKAGQWDLSQVLGHLSAWMTYPVEGFPFKTLPWLVRVTFGRMIRRHVLKSRTMPPGIKTPASESVPQQGEDELRAETRFRSAVKTFESHEGDYLPSPFMGRMTRDQWTQLQLIHCAHHLSFLVPKTSTQSHTVPT